MILQPKQSSFLKECPKGSFRVCLSNKITAGLPLNTQGIENRTSLPYRLENIVAFRVLYYNISCASGSLPTSSGYLFALRSARLGSKLSSNPFSIGVALDSPNTYATPISDVIAMAAYVGENVNNHDTFPFADVNQKMYFNAPQSIDTFDWTITPVNGSFTFAASFSIEAVIEFYPLCQC